MLMASRHANARDEEPAYRPPPRPLRRSSSHDIEHDFTSHADLVTSPGQEWAAAATRVCRGSVRCRRAVTSRDQSNRIWRTVVAYRRSEARSGRRWTA